jgi:drug/metabolite transporter (DMT)-like permease
MIVNGILVALAGVVILVTGAVIFDIRAVLFGLVCLLGWGLGHLLVLEEERRMNFSKSAATVASESTPPGSLGLFDFCVW